MQYKLYKVEHLIIQLKIKEYKLLSIPCIGAFNNNIKPLKNAKVITWTTQTTTTEATKMVKVTIRVDLSKEQNNLLEHQMTLEGEKCKATFIRKTLFKNSLSDSQKIDKIFRELCEV